MATEKMYGYWKRFVLFLVNLKVNPSMNTHIIQMNSPKNHPTHSKIINAVQI